MMSSDAQHESDHAIRLVEREYDAAWNRGDVAALVSLYEQQAVLVNPRGEIARGQAEIRPTLEAFLGGPAKGSTHSSTITDIAYVVSTVAIVDGIARLDELRGESESIVHHFTDVFVKTETGWSIAHTRAYVFAGRHPLT